MRILHLPLPCYAPPDGPGGGAPAASSSPAPSPSPASTSTPAPAASTEAPKLAESGSPAPVTTPPVEGLPETPATDEFAGFGSSDDDVVAVPADEELAAPPPEAPPAVPPKAPEAAPPVVPPVAPPPTEAAPAPAEAAPKEQPSSAPVGPGTLAQQLEEHGEAVLGRLAQEFALSKEEADVLGPDMAEMAPKIAARVYKRAVQSTLLHMQNFVPLMVASAIQQFKANDEKEGKFYGQFKYLDKTKHAADVNQFLQVFRQREPNLNEEQLWAKAASAVKALHNLQDVIAPAVNGQQPPQSPQIPAFIPASPGRGGARVETVPSPWDGMGQDFGDEG